MVFFWILNGLTTRSDLEFLCRYDYVCMIFMFVRLELLWVMYGSRHWLKIPKTVLGRIINMIRAKDVIRRSSGGAILLASSSSSSSPMFFSRPPVFSGSVGWSALENIPVFIGNLYDVSLPQGTLGHLHDDDYLELIFSTRLLLLWEGLGRMVWCPCRMGQCFIQFVQIYFFAFAFRLFGSFIFIYGDWGVVDNQARETFAVSLQCSAQNPFADIPKQATAF